LQPQSSGLPELRSLTPVIQGQRRDKSKSPGTRALHASNKVIVEGFNREIQVRKFRLFGVVNNAPVRGHAFSPAAQPMPSSCAQDGMKWPSDCYSG
jgi:hypothetical protein